jgi:peptidoglycan/xylan/chitin deacetylase (PgdA/CDA1 family)
VEPEAARRTPFSLISGSCKQVWSVSILCYHSIDVSWRSRLVVSPADFADHAGWLARHRSVVPLHEAVRQLDRSGRLPPRTAALTFDDGYAALHEHAFPELLRHRLPATVFLVADTLTERGHEVDWVDDAPPSPPGTLSAEQILEMHDGGVAFGSHSFAHEDLTTLGEAECEQDLRASREVIQDVLGAPVTYLAYPRGRHNERVRRCARRAGFTHGFTLPESAERPGEFSIPRVGIYPGNGRLALRLKTTRSYLPVRTSRLWPVLRPALRPTRIGGAS